MSDGPLAGGVFVEYLFARQLVQAEPSQYLPALHKQSEAASDPAALLEEAGQARHTLASGAPDAGGVLAEYVLALQPVQAVPDQYLPALHTQSLAASDPAALLEEAGQARHTLLSEAPDAGGVLVE